MGLVALKIYVVFQRSDLHQIVHLICCEIHKSRMIDVAQLLLRELSLPAMDADNSEKNSLYELIGGDAAVRALVDSFYDLMDLEPEFKLLRAMHPATLEGSRDKLYFFLSGWMGGPDLYTPRFGNAFLRARHLPFKIGSQERDEWLTCMLLAMRDLNYSEQTQDVLLNSLFGKADWMRNKTDE